MATGNDKKIDFKHKVKLHIKIPTYKNDLTPITASQFRKLGNNILKKFGRGYTILPPTRGAWVSPTKETVLDVTVAYEMFIDDNFFTTEIEPTLVDYLEELKKEFDQHDISCYYHDMMCT